VEPSDALQGLPGVLGVIVEAGGLRQRLAFSPSQTTAATLIADVARRVAVRDLTVAEPSIEDLVRT
jgi:ABC-2 type transport system ATP-binding protein